MTALRTLFVFGFVFGTILLIRPALSADGGDTVVQMSAYNTCESGGNQSKWSSLKPAQYTLDQNSQLTEIAVPTRGPMSALRGKCFKAVGGFSDDPKNNSYLKTIQNRIFFGGDGCPGCSKAKGARVDISTSCHSGLSRKLLLQKVHLKPTPCPQQIQAAFTGSAASRQLASVPSDSATATVGP